jgi:hypothetical protein
MDSVILNSNTAQSFFHLTPERAKGSPEKQGIIFDQPIQV